MEKKFIEFVKNLYRPREDSVKADNGQLTIIGGSRLFHGPPIMALKVASRIVDMVFLATPSEDKPVADALRSQLSSFIWVPRPDLEKYIEKSDAALIGPGMMRYAREGVDPTGVYDEAGTETKRITEYLLQRFPGKKWIIDGGALQTMDAKFIPKNSILTPNKKEFARLFGEEMNYETVSKWALRYSCVIVGKLKTSVVCDGGSCEEITGSTLGLSKGGTGDTLAATIAAFACKNDPFLAAVAGITVGRLAVERLIERVGTMYNSDDLADEIPRAYKWCLEGGR